MHLLEAELELRRIKREASIRVKVLLLPVREMRIGQAATGRALEDKYLRSPLELAVPMKFGLLRCNRAAPPSEYVCWHQTANSESRRADLV